MAPTTRSTNKNSDDSDTPSNTPRKAPRCTKCGRPRAGHPRSGCPFADSPIKQSPTEVLDSDALAPATPSPRKGRRKLLSEDINDAMGSMHIRTSPSPETEKDTKVILRDRRRKSRPSGIAPLKASDTLVSLSSTSNEIVEQLLQPGALEGDNTEPEEHGHTTPSKKERARSARIIQWEETLIAATPKVKKSVPPMPKSSPSSPMPGTLITPNASFFDSYASIAEEKPPKINVTCPTEGSFSMSSATSVPNAPKLHQAKPLSRTMSMEQRQMFISSELGPASKAAIHVLPKADIYDIADAAHAIGFFAVIVTNEHTVDNQSLLVIGKEEDEVEKLLSLVCGVEDAKRRQKMASTSSSSPPQHAPEKSRSTTSALKVAAGGAVVGAVGAWAGLAFS